MTPPDQINLSKPNFSSSNFVLMIGGQILIIVLALIVLFFGSGTITQSNISKNINSQSNNK